MCERGIESIEFPTIDYLIQNKFVRCLRWDISFIAAEKKNRFKTWGTTRKFIVLYLFFFPFFASMAWQCEKLVQCHDLRKIIILTQAPSVVWKNWGDDSAQLLRIDMLVIVLYGKWNKISQISCAIASLLLSRWIKMNKLRADSSIGAPPEKLG